MVSNERYIEKLELSNIQISKHCIPGNKTRANWGKSAWSISQAVALAFLALLALGTIAFLSPVAAAADDGNGAVYTMTNAAAGNEVIRYDRAADGTLIFSGTFSTNGMGTGSSLGSQGGLVLSEEGDLLLVVNAGSNDTSVFRVKPKGLMLTDKVSSGGIQPISIAIHEDLVYVLNAGASGNIAGFHLSNKGKLSLIPGSTRPLSGIAVGPAEIAFDPDGKVLVVTEKSSNIIDTYTVDKKGIANGPMTHASNGATPFGFAFDKKGHLIVSEAASNALSSYAVDDHGNLVTISGSIPDFQIAACWVVVTKNGKFAYTNNAHSGTISSYEIGKTGMISLLDSIAGTPGTGNIDLALSKNSKFLYSLNFGVSTIAGFRVNPDGSLTPVTTVSVPGGANGLAAR
ncbi:MAG: beta-propeller fold lactonase family protein [Candidatus Methanoperedens sp.]|nr:beta-propeller fold lactonase family protein [Candidatus Methanoperedens sp.]MCZ7369027.1 beta-propeller fold lactonase family protein [Candidatus Methanoperedens sp.]